MGMLRLVKVFDLQKDVFTKIPHSRLEIPSNYRKSEDEGIPELTLSSSTSNLAVIGQEKTGHIIVTYNGYEQGKPITFIDVYDTKNKTLKSVYKHSEIMNCVNASISSEHTLLAFTIEVVDENLLSSVKLSSKSASNPKLSKSTPSTKRKKEETQTVFQSYIAEVRENGVLYKLSICLPIVQRVQFLTTENAKIVYLLFFLETKMIHLYQVPIRKLANNNGVEITTQPNLVSYVVKNYVWSEWEPYKNYLYVLQKLDVDPAAFYGETEQNRSNPHYRMYVLKLFEIPDRSFKLLWELPLKMKISIPKFYSQKYFFYRGVDHRVSNAISRLVHLVQLDGNAFVLCQQHPIMETHATSIKVSLFLLHTKGKLDIHIPMNNVELQVILETRVFFGSIANMLLIYVPNFYFQMVDCGSEHAPCLGISSPILATSISKTNQKSEKTQADLITKYPTAADSSDLHGHCLLDCATGIVYEYSLDRESILHLFSSKKVETQVQALHLAIVHMKDDELLEQIMSHICTNYPEKITTNLLKEFLIGCPYVNIKRNNPSNMLLPVLPITSLTPLKYHIAFTELHGYYVAPSTTALIIKDKEQLKLPPRFQFEATTLNSVSDNHQRYIELQPLPISKLNSFFKSFLNLGSSTEVTANDTFDTLDEDTLSSLYKGSLNLVEYISNHYINCYPKIGKPQITKYAKEYRRKILKETNRLYQYIERGLESERPAIEMYQVFESFYCALEELYYPSPKGFSHKFVTLGEQCLPRSVFLQYIERGVFNLNEEFILSTFAKLKNTEEDKLFKYELLSTINSKNKSFEIMLKQSEYADYLLQNYLSNLSLPPPSKEMLEGPSNLERTNDSPFIPRTVFLESITAYFEKEKDSAIVNFVNQSKQQLHSSLDLL